MNKFFIGTQKFNTIKEFYLQLVISEITCKLLIFNILYHV